MHRARWPTGRTADPGMLQRALRPSDTDEVVRRAELTVMLATRDLPAGTPVSEIEDLAFAYMDLSDRALTLRLKYLG